MGSLLRVHMKIVATQTGRFRGTLARRLGTAEPGFGHTGLIHLFKLVRRQRKAPNSRTGPSRAWAGPKRSYLKSTNCPDALGRVRSKWSNKPVRLLVQGFEAEHWARCITTIHGRLTNGLIGASNATPFPEQSCTTNPETLRICQFAVRDEG